MTTGYASLVDADAYKGFTGTLTQTVGGRLVSRETWERGKLVESEYHPLHMVVGGGSRASLRQFVGRGRARRMRARNGLR